MHTPSLTPVLLATLLGAGCGWFFRAPAPVATIEYSPPSVTTGDLLILLPGRGDRARSFAEAGVVDVIRQRSPGLRVVAVDATLGYYIHRNLPERLDLDVIEPARARGHRSIWVAGISMGGLGALLYAERHPQVIEGVLLVAPFLGDEPVIAEIEMAGGLHKWRPPAHVDPEDYQRELWRWLKACTAQVRTCPRVLLGFGSNDRFARAHRLLAAALPASAVAEVPGEHNWEPWRKLFAELVPRMSIRHP
jgi:pimeloyl-ACP methyl ester carboxylesterase